MIPKSLIQADKLYWHLTIRPRWKRILRSPMTFMQFARIYPLRWTTAWRLTWAVITYEPMYWMKDFDPTKHS